MGDVPKKFHFLTFPERSALRDEFAKAAMPVILARFTVLTTNEELVAKVAAAAYEMADAMMHERDKNAVPFPSSRS